MNCGIKLKSKPKKNRGKTYIPSPIDTNRAKATPTSGPGTPEETDRANKVKTAVTYREILEKLPQPDGGRASPRWKKFWESLDLNFESSCSLPLSHPLRPLWEKYNSKDKLTQKNLLETGSDLYRILSAIVHSPRINNYDIFHGHWSQELEDILRALEPDPSIPNIRGEPDWDKQRERFQIKVEDKVNQSTANKNPERSRKEKKPDNADQEQVNYSHLSKGDFS